MKEKVISFFLCLFLGTLGAHRLYLGKKKTAFLMLITIGGCGIWYLLDLIAILRGRLHKKEKKLFLPI